MNVTSALPLALALAAMPAVSIAGTTSSTGQLPVPANHVLGLWETDIHVSPQACSKGAPPPPLFGRNTLVFNAGGTLVENPRVSPAGVPGAPQLRSIGLGDWSYNVRTHRYSALVRFDLYSSTDGTWIGYMDVERTILLSNDRRTAAGPVVATRYAPDGSVVLRLCGHGISRRL